jgi:hypothetical protein
MEVSTTLLVGVGMLIPIAVLVFLLVLSGREGRGPLATGVRAEPTPTPDGAPTHRGSWMTVVEALALPLDTERSATATTLRIRGNLGAPVCDIDIKIRIPEDTPPQIWSDLAAGIVPAQRDRSRTEGPQIVIRAERDIPMPDGLQVTSDATGSQTQGYLGKRDLGTGDAALDNLVRVRGEDRIGIRGLLADPEVQAALAALAREETDFEWSAGHIVLRTTPVDNQPYPVMHVVEQTRALARLLDAASRRFAQPWQALAGALGLRLDVSLDPPTLTGTRDGIRVLIAAHYERGEITLQTDPGDEPRERDAPKTRWKRRRPDTPLDTFLRDHEEARFEDGVLRMPLVTEPTPEPEIRAAITALQEHLKTGARDPS